MPVVSVTRLRLGSAQYQDEFFVAAIACVEQALATPGNRYADTLADQGNVYWTRTIWDSEAVMRDYIRTDPHRGVLANLRTWCDEATFVHWHQDGDQAPEWTDAHAKLVAEGQTSHVNHPSEAHDTRSFPPPQV